MPGIMESCTMVYSTWIAPSFPNKVFHFFTYSRHVGYVFDFSMPIAGYILRYGPPKSFKQILKVLMGNRQKICEHVANASGFLLVAHHKKVGCKKLIVCALPWLFGALPRKMVWLMRKLAFWLPGLAKTTVEISGSSLIYR